MKIYTKKGDKGFTSLLGENKVPKYDTRIEAYGSVDELGAHIGLLRDLCESDKDTLLRIQDRLFTLSSMLAATDDCKMKLPKIKEADILYLEESIDSIDVPKLTSFILTGGHPTISHCHIARTVCRRAERRVVELNNDRFDLIVKYLNRLSDYLFTLARKITKDLGVEEIKWVAEKN